ncbi:hypothetical protein PCANB_000932 [Pneumocystis canis]|nr:hypothetical protein PCANB_000932 [Pneumocystis canis]
MTKLRMDVQFMDAYCLAGEPLSCIITFTHPKLDTQEKTKNIKKETILSTRNSVKSYVSVKESLFFQKNHKKSNKINDKLQNNSKVIMDKDKITLTPSPPKVNTDIPFDASKIDKTDKKLSLDVLQENMNNSYDCNYKSNNVENEIKQNMDLNTDLSKFLKNSFHNETKNETLMISYIQINGYLILNEKIIKIEKFEELKTNNKNSIKSCKGGFVGTHTKINQKSGFIGYLDSLGVKLNTLLKNHSISSLNEFKKIQDPEYIPILSTPPSILFVDLQLAPGESRSYGYKFTLPSQLPPSYEGKSIKVRYFLSITTQRSGKDIQQLETSEIPFDVLYKIDESGNQIVYDLFSPIFFFIDEAHTFDYNPSESVFDLSNIKEITNNSYFQDEDEKCSKEDFIHYLSEHLHDESFKKLFLYHNTKENIDISSSDILIPERNPLVNMANIINNITMSNLTYNNSNKRFNINKNGNIIGVISILKSCYKLGEIINGVIDFSIGKLPCYQIKFFLETIEMIDPSISICSKANISQTTRKIYDSYSETTLYASRIQFKLTIPNTASPSFKTSEISLLWIIRLEMTVPLLVNNQQNQSKSSVDISTTEKLLIESYRDYRGTHYSASSSLECEAFDCVIPITIFPLLKLSTISNPSNSTIYF